MQLRSDTFYLCLCQSTQGHFTKRNPLNPLPRPCHTLAHTQMCAHIHTHTHTLLSSCITARSCSVSPAASGHCLQPQKAEAPPAQSASQRFQPLHPKVQPRGLLVPPAPQPPSTALPAQTMPHTSPEQTPGSDSATGAGSLAQGTEPHHHDPPLRGPRAAAVPTLGCARRGNATFGSI